MLRILLVEDNKADARLTGEILKDTGLEHELVWIKEGKKALELIGSGADFDLFILDLNLPRFNGLEIIAVLRKAERFRKTPVIVMTGARSPENLPTKELDQFLHYMVKPMTIDEMDGIKGAIKDIVLGSRT